MGLFRRSKATVETERTAGGQPVDRGDPTRAVSGLHPAPPGLVEARDAHLARHLGSDHQVFHEIVSEAVHLDVHVFPPTAARPFTVLVTSGMSDLPMTVPPGYEAHARAELVIGLPAQWPLGFPGTGTDGALEDERNYWPIRLLKDLGRLPHRYGTGLGWGHSIPNGDPAEPYADGVPFTGALIGPPAGLPEDFMIATTPVGPVVYYGVIPVTSAEMELKISSPQGGEVVIDRLGDAGVGLVVDVTRRSVA